MAAKVDSALVQDGFQIYHHAFFFSKSGAWSVVQQGMNTDQQTARRYHWFSESIKDLVCEPHSAIASEKFQKQVLNLVSKNSADTRQTSVALIQGGYHSLIKDINLIRKHSSPLSQMASVKFGQQRLTLLNLENKEFDYHPVVTENFSKSRYLEKILAQVVGQEPKNYEKLLAISGVGPKTMRALALVSEVIYGAKPSYEDPARYSFALGGKDATPYPIDRITYDKIIEILKEVINKTHWQITDKNKAISRLENQTTKK